MNIQDAITWLRTQEAMTPQKLLDYSYAWGIVLQNDDVARIECELFQATFEAWVHGPIHKPTDDAHRIYGDTPMPQLTSRTPHNAKNDYAILAEVYAVYGGYTAEELETMTAQEEPWQKTAHRISRIRSHITHHQKRRHLHLLSTTSHKSIKKTNNRNLYGYGCPSTRVSMQSNT